MPKQDLLGLLGDGRRDAVLSEEVPLPPSVPDVTDAAAVSCLDPGTLFPSAEEEESSSESEEEEEEESSAP